ncbi:DnaD domain-containing protein [Aeribacillus sp. FSL M8-0235]|uniref:DnaD domain-containing protein n=1 Tax=Aeribacillus sp. FSL M8-0235 TaxID=2954576 RepID=UPI0030F78129
MNYIKELNAFYDWLELNELSPSAINLWYALMHINNKAGWTETFTVAESVLCVKTGLTDRTLRKVRNELKQKGRIDFISRKGKAPIYKIIPFNSSEQSTENNSEHNKRSEINSAVRSEVSSGVSSAPSSEVSSALIKHKQNETKQKNKEDEEDAHTKNPFRFFEQNGFGTISPYIAEKISMWIDDLSEELVLEAMKIAVENGARSWNYVETILRDWASKKLTTVEQVQAERLAYQQSKAKYPKKPIRQEIVPEWVHDTQTTVDEAQNIADFEEEKRKLLERIRKYKSG